MYKALIVDDEKMIRMGMRNSIPWNSIGIGEVYTAKSGKEALKIIKENVPEIMITDIKMDEMTGLDLIEAAKKYLEFMASESSLEYLTDNVGKFNKLAYTNAPSKYSDTINEFYNRYSSQGTVLQTAVKYVNPQWMDIGTDISAMLLGEMTPDDVLKSVDKRRADQAKAANDEAWVN